MDTSFRGTIKLDDHIRSFDFKDRIIFIHPTEDESDFFSNLFNSEYKHYDLIVGKSYENHLVYFLDVTVLKNNNKYHAYPMAYTIINSNTMNWEYDIFDFKKLKLKSTAIDSLQNIEYSNKLEHFFIKNKYDSNIDPIIKRFEITQGKCELVTEYNLISRDINTSINISSNLNIVLNQKTSIFDVYQLVKKISEVFKFIFNRSNITFSSIKLETEQITICDDFDKTSETNTFPATLCVLNQTNSFKARNINQITPLILKNFNSLIKVVNKDIISYYPKDDKDFNYVDVEKFIKVCGTFEREFKDCFADWLPINEADYDYIKQEILNYIDELDKYFYKKNRNIRKKIQSFRNIITNMNEKLEKRLKFAFNEFAYCLEPRLKKYCNRTKLNNTSFDEICTCFADKRNKYVHTFNDLGFTQEEIAGFVMVRELIFCMILKQAGFTNQEIEQMINTFQ